MRHRRWRRVRAGPAQRDDEGREQRGQPRAPEDHCGVRRGPTSDAEISATLRRISADVARRDEFTVEAPSPRRGFCRWLPSIARPGPSSRVVEDRSRPDRGIVAAWTRRTTLPALPACAARQPAGQARRPRGVRRPPTDDPDRHQPARAGQARGERASSTTSGRCSGGRRTGSCRGSPTTPSPTRTCGRRRTSRVSRSWSCTRFSAEHSDATIEALPLDAPGEVPWWGEDRARDAAPDPGAHVRRDGPARRPRRHRAGAHRRRRREPPGDPNIPEIDWVALPRPGRGRRA